MSAFGSGIIIPCCPAYGVGIPGGGGGAGALVFETLASFESTPALGYIPLNGENMVDPNISDNEVRIYHARAGQLNAITIPATLDAGDTTFGLHLNENATAVATVTIDVDTPDTRFVFDFTGLSNTFAATDAIHISIDDTPPAAQPLWFCVIEWELTGDIVAP